MKANLCECNTIQRVKYRTHWYDDCNSIQIRKYTTSVWYPDKEIQSTLMRVQWYTVLKCRAHWSFWTRMASVEDGCGGAYLLRRSGLAAWCHLRDRSPTRSPLRRRRPTRHWSCRRQLGQSPWWNGFVVCPIDTNVLYTHTAYIAIQSHSLQSTCLQR